MTIKFRFFREVKMKKQTPKILAIGLSFLLSFTAAGYAFANSDKSDSRSIIKTEKSKYLSEKRVALVIGNSKYKSSPLKNPVNDSRAISEALNDLGFEVISGEDLTQKEMKKKIAYFGKKIKNGGVGLFYYAGHGMQVNGYNYLIPVKSIINSEEDVEYEAVNAGRVLAQMDSAKNRLNIVILDACRDNPFARSFRSGTKGLAQMDAPSGTLLAYATAPGSVASDGSGQNAVYTKGLISTLKTPGLKIEDVFKRVRAKVRKETGGKQTPWESSSLEGDFYFKMTDAINKSQSSQADRASLDAERDAIEREKIKVEKKVQTLRKEAAILEELNQLKEKRSAREAKAKKKVYRTKSGRILTPAEVDALVRKGKIKFRSKDGRVLTKAEYDKLNKRVQEKKNRKPAYDRFGKPTYDPKYYDSKGRSIYDSKGNRLTYSDSDGYYNQASKDRARMNRLYDQAQNGGSYLERNKARREIYSHDSNKRYEANKAARLQRERQKEFEDKRNRSGVREDSRYRKKYETKRSRGSRTRTYSRRSGSSY